MKLLFLILPFMFIRIKLSSPNISGLFGVGHCAQRHHDGHKDKTIRVLQGHAIL